MRMQEAVYMKSWRLLGLFLVSLFLTACWLSSLPASEHPWDEDEVVTSDSSDVIQDHNPGDGLGDNTRYIVIIPSDLGLPWIRGFGVVHVYLNDDIVTCKTGVSHAPRKKSAQAGTTLPLGKVQSTTKK
jgi:hypothetical protein